MTPSEGEYINCYSPQAVIISEDILPHIHPDVHFASLGVLSSSKLAIKMGFKLCTKVTSKQITNWS